jgi:CMP-N-acetylneuraminic acid synthetase
MSHEILAIIPARGGSKGLPGKNIRSLAGKPLIEYVINAALQSTQVTRTVVSTDDDSIASVAGSAGAEVIIRPKDIAGDNSPSEQAVLHVLETLKTNENYIPDIVVFLQCTSPLTISDDIDGIVSSLNTSNADSALSASLFHHFLWKNTSDGSVEGINHDYRSRSMRQDLDAQYLENGAIYAFKTQGFIKHRYRFFGKIHIYEMPAERCLEIDVLEDFKLAESILEM